MTPQQTAKVASLSSAITALGKSVSTAVKPVNRTGKCSFPLDGTEIYLLVTSENNGSSGYVAISPNGAVDLPFVRSFPGGYFSAATRADELEKGRTPDGYVKARTIASKPCAPSTVRATTYQTVTLDRAMLAVNVYNKGLYGYIENADLDDRARVLFEGGLGTSLARIEEQVGFIGRDYGGAAGFKAAYALVPDIARDIFANRDCYEREALAAPNILSRGASRKAIELLYGPFRQDFLGKRNWKVWAAKFWHHLNPDAFPIRDSRVDRFFALRASNPIDEYMDLIGRFVSFVLAHQQWLPHLRKIDNGADQTPCSDNKLWDKMCYGLVDLDEAGK